MSETRSGVGEPMSLAYLPGNRPASLKTGSAWTRRFIAVSVLIALLIGWECASDSDVVVIFFGRPSHVAIYLMSQPLSVLWASAQCAGVAVVALLASGLLSVLLLAVGALRDGGLASIERIGAIFQTVPTLVIVTISLLLETQLFSLLKVDAPASLYCVVPVTLALMFPPLVNGASAINRTPVQLKAMLRLWSAPRLWRIRRVYLPLALPDVLTGIRSSATWAVSATLIAEGLLNGATGSTDTLGHALMRPFSNSTHPGQTPAVIAISIALGFAVYYLFASVQSRIEERLHGDAILRQAAYPLQEPTSASSSSRKEACQ